MCTPTLSCMQKDDTTTTTPLLLLAFPSLLLLVGDGSYEILLQRISYKEFQQVMNMKTSHEDPSE